MAAVAIGMVATLFMDAWNLLLRLGFAIGSLDYCMLGRWMRHVPAAFRHASIAAASKRPGECVAGWIAHYSIGSLLALAFVLFSPLAWLARPTLLPALVFGLATVVFPRHLCRIS